jgi:hypothetical protein
MANLRSVSLDGLFANIQQGTIKDLNLSAKLQSLRREPLSSEQTGEFVLKAVAFRVHAGEGSWLLQCLGQSACCNGINSEIIESNET